MDELPLSGDEWQEWADKLLQRYYGPGKYQKVPDKDRGDAGIEGFSLDGTVYQAYGPEEPLSGRERCEKQCNKITRDIKKFVDNQSKLADILGDIKISRWVLFVPKYESKDLVSHARKKTEEVKKANLPYVAPDFRVCIEDEVAFSIERDELLKIGMGKFVISFTDADAQAVEGWIEGNSDLVDVIDDKASRLPKLDMKEKKQSFRQEIIRHFLDGQNVLEGLRQYPLFYEHIVHTKSNRERFLVVESMTTPYGNMEFLTQCLDRFQTEIEAQIKTLPPGMLNALKWEAVADWIIRCPLDFQ